jgi:hypothetical protein
MADDLVQVPRQEYERLLSSDQIAEIGKGLLRNPDVSDEFKAIIKRAHPQVEIPDWEIKQNVSKQISDLKKQIEDEKRAAREAAEIEKWNSAKAKVQQEFGLTPEGMKDLEEFMKEKGVGDYEVAATYRHSKNPPQSEANHSDGFWHHEKEPGYEELVKDPEGYAYNQILAAVRADQARERGGR